MLIIPRTALLILSVNTILINTLLIRPEFLRTEKGDLNCCGSKIMDNRGHVMIDKGYVIPQGRYTSMKLQLCTKDPVTIQIWEIEQQTTTLKLKWHMEYSAEYFTNQDSMTVVSFEDYPLMITEKDRLGIFSRSTEKIPLPYEFNRNAELATFFSKTTFANHHSMTLGTSIELDRLGWPNRFRDSVVLCNTSYCSNSGGGNQIHNDVIFPENTSEQTTTIRQHDGTMSPLNGDRNCDLLMNNTGHVIIHTGQALPEGVYTSIELRVCTSDPVTIQIWSFDDVDSFEDGVLKWQMEYEPTQKAQQDYSTIVLNLEESPLTITSQDYLGIFSLSQSKIPLPYEFNGDGVSSFSKDTFTERLSIGSKIKMDKLSVPYVFRASVRLCNAETCHSNATLPTVTMVPDITQTTVFDNLQYTSSTAEPSKNDQCDINVDSLLASMHRVEQRNMELATKINELTAVVTAISRMNNRATGICPSGFEAGWYGVGKCYKVVRQRQPAHIALLSCQRLRSRLVAFRTTSEAEYVSKQIFEQGDKVGHETFWTGGIYNDHNDRWQWYPDSAWDSTALDYTNWAPGQPNLKEKKECIYTDLHLNGTTVTNFWHNGACSDEKFYVCEVQKTCL